MVLNRLSFALSHTSLRRLLLTSLLLVNLFAGFEKTSAEGGLELGSVVVSEKGETRRLDLRPNEYVELRVHRDGDPILLVSLADVQGQKIIDTRTGRYEDLVLRFITPGTGPYSLTITPFEKQSIGTQCKLMVDVSRPASSDDLIVVKGDAAFREAERLRSQWNEKDLRSSIDRYAEAFDAWRSSGRHSEATLALQSIGEVYFMLSEYDSAIEYFERARKNGSTHGDRVRQIQALNDIGYVHIYLSEYSQAIPYFNKALDLEKTLPDRDDTNTSRRLRATTLNNLGEAHYSLADLKKAMDFFDKALALWSAAGDRRGQALAELNIGYTFYDKGDMEAAREHYERSVPLWQVTDDRRGEALSRTALGGIHSFFGERQQALNAHSEAMRVLQQIGDRQGQAAALNGLARVYEESNDLKTALDDYEQAVRLYQGVKNREYEALTEAYVGRVYRAMKDMPTALERYNRSISIFREIRNRRLQAYSQKDVASIFNDQGRHSEALSMLTDVLRLYREIGDRRGQAQTLNGIGLIHQSLQQASVAKSYFLSALSLNRAGDNRAGEAATRYNIARVERMLGALPDALAEIREAMKIIESLRSSLARYELRYSYFALMQDYYALYIDLLLQQHKHNPDQSLVTAAFEASESTRARSLREILTEAKVDIRAGVPEELLSRERALQRELSVSAKYYLRLKNYKRTESEAREVEREVRRLKNDYSEVEAQIRAQSPRYAELTQPELPATREIQTKLLDDQTVLLEFFLGAEKSYLWLLSKTSLQVHELPKRDDLEKTAQDLYELITARQPRPQEDSRAYEKRVADADAAYWPQAAALSKTLLGPVANDISGKRLLIVTDGALQYIPFAALPDPNTANAADPTPLIVEHEIINLPSAATLYSLRQEKPQSVAADRLLAVFADPVFADTDPRVSKQARAAATASPDENSQFIPAGFSARDMSPSDRSTIPRLPSTRVEGEAIMRFVPDGQGVVASGFDASRSQLMDHEMSRFQILHFATHGIVNSEHPELSGIVLSMVNEQGAPEDGFFQLHDIYKLKLSAQLVVLSACSSGLGKNVRGEGFIGLTRAFMYAGARSTVASLWRVDDNATTELMRQFYSAMLNERMSPPAALKSAKEKMWKHPRWRHPFYWAAFVIQGEYVGTIKYDANRSSTSVSVTRVTAVAGSLMVVVVGVYLARRLRRRRATRVTSG